MMGEALKGHLDMLLLAVLAEGPAHGYIVIEALRERSGGAFDLSEGTIYPALHRLEVDGLLASEWTGTGGRRRRVYQLTPKGTAMLAQRQQEWRQFSHAVEATIGI
jgi:PadR family transcriptional regulator, regulatory protein PadR